MYGDKKMNWKNETDIIEALRECRGAYLDSNTHKENLNLLENTMVAVQSLLALIDER